MADAIWSVSGKLHCGIIFSNLFWSMLFLYYEICSPCTTKLHLVYLPPTRYLLICEQTFWFTIWNTPTYAINNIFAVLFLRFSFYTYLENILAPSHLLALILICSHLTPATTFISLISSVRCFQNLSSYSLLVLIFFFFFPLWKLSLKYIYIKIYLCLFMIFQFVQHM